MSYYYLISSLPMLKPDGDMPISYEQFLGLCKSSLDEQKLSLLTDLTLMSTNGPLVKEWAIFYQELNQELTYQRSQRLGIKAKLPDFRYEQISKLVSQALNHKNPLSAELMLLELEFQKLDELIGLHYFDEEALFGYALKLKLLERKSSFKIEQGKAEFNRIIVKLEEQIMSME